MSDDGPTVALRLCSRPQTLTIVRGMLSGVAELLEMDPELLDDLKTAVSEACNNVVLHAYPDGEGPMEVRVFADADGIRVVVDDEGVGPEGAGDSAGDEPGIGVSVIRALAQESSFDSRTDGGTEVSMRFDAHRDGRTLFARPRPAAPDVPFASLHDDELGLSLSPVSLLTGVLGRLARTLAATAHFSLDRFSDVYLVTDSIAAHAAGAAAGDRIHARLEARERRLELTVGPFAPGASERLTRSGGLDPAGALDRPGAGPLGSPLALLADELSVVEVEGGEAVRVVVVDHRR